MMREKVAKPKRRVIKPNTQEQVEGMVAVCEWGINVSIDEGTKSTSSGNIRKASNIQAFCV
jgi:hypothetical protein